jgi:glycosyltransferase involved in cell wall biosynthesis
MTLVINGMPAGGAERVLSILANQWVGQGHQVHLLCLDDNQTPSFYPLDPAITRGHLPALRRGMNSGQRAANFLRRLSTISPAIRGSNPAIVVSFGDRANVMTLLSARRLKLPVLACERTYPRAAPLGPSWRLLRLAAYPLAASVVTQTESALACFPRRIRRSGCVIPNPLTVPPAHRGCALRGGGSAARRIIIAVGRLHREKGHDLLVRAFAQVCQRHPAWSLEIWGDGPARAEIEGLVAQLKLTNRARLPGLTQEPLEKLSAADLFVLPSRREGFPNALCEAMACGLPVVSSDCLCGPREIIRHGVDGLLVPSENVGALAESLESLMANPELRRKLALRAPEVLDRFGLESVMQQWQTLLSRVTAHEARRS